MPTLTINYPPEVLWALGENRMNLKPNPACFRP